MTKPQQNERWTFHLAQMIEAVLKIERYTSGMTMENFLADERTIDAVIRNLEIIGEATHHIPNKIRKHYGAIPWMELRYMRNFLAHEYFAVDPKSVWETISHDINRLKKSLERVCEEAAE